MKSQPNCIVFELAKKERNVKTKTLKYSLPIDADIETHFAYLIQQLKKDGVHLCKNDLRHIVSDCITAMVEGIRQGVIPVEQLEVSGVLSESINH